MLLKKYTLNFLFFFLSVYSYAQIGGIGVYTFLQLPGTSHVSALGGTNVSVVSNEPSFLFQNPALLNDSLTNIAFLATSKYFADIYYGTAAYTFKEKHIGNMLVGIQHVNYGIFDKFDELGNNTGNFKAADYALFISASRTFADSNFSYGITLKPVYSSYEAYYSWGLVAEAGVLYYNPNALFSTGLVLKNFGYQFKSYYSNHYEPVDADLQLGITKKLKHAPLRINLTFMHLEHWNMASYVKDKTNTDMLNADSNSNKRTNFDKWSDEFLRHVIVSTDFILSKNFYIALGYNFQRRKELGTDTRMATTGLSWGFGLKIYRFQFHYARAAYNLAGASNMISISSRINDWYKKTEKL